MSNALSLHAATISLSSNGSYNRMPRLLKNKLSRFGQREVDPSAENQSHGPTSTDPRSERDQHEHPLHRHLSAG